MNGLYPFVSIAAFHPSVYPIAFQFVVDIRDKAALEKKSSITSASIQQGSLSIDDFRADPRYGDDGNRIDLAYALYALRHGGTPEAIAVAIRTRDLSKKGSERRQASYVLRTIQKALSGEFRSSSRRR